MKTLKITKSDLDGNNCYSGTEEFSDCSNPFNGHVEIDENLGYVGFKKSLLVSGSIVAKAGSGIEAGEGIKAGSGIEAGSGIKAGWGIKAGSGIKAGEGIKAGWGIVSLYSSVRAGLSITFSAKCAIAAGIFSLSGPQEVEAQEIIGGTVAYGTVKLLPKEDGRKSDLLAKAGELMKAAEELRAEGNAL